MLEVVHVHVVFQKKFLLIEKAVHYNRKSCIIKKHELFLLIYLYKLPNKYPLYKHCMHYINSKSLIGQQMFITGA